jgi:uncharacterized lipoprotein YddW (UPF0748 family)
MQHRRPAARWVYVLVPVVIVVVLLGLGLGLLRAAIYQPGDRDSAADRVRPDGTATATATASADPLAQPTEAGPAGGAVGRCGTVPVRAERQLRGMWLTTVLNLDFPSKPGLPEATVKAEYERWLDLAVAQRHNAIFVHVRPSGDAFWPSPYAPWSDWLTGRRDNRSPGWDPMKFMVDEAHARNLQFHAWFNPYRGSQPAPDGGAGTDFAKLAPGHPLLAHRDWAIAYPTGKTGRLYFDPGNPAARAFVEDAMLDAVRRYDVDGVHFDDFFYPYPELGQDFPDGASFAKYGAGRSRADWRRTNVDALVHEMSVRIKQLKPWVQFGISPFGIWRNKSTDPAGSASGGLESYDAQFADTRKWVREGWLDYVVPQLYWTIGFARADYAKLLPWWSALVKGTDVQLYIGQADYRIGEPGAWSDPAELDRHLALDGRYGVQGEVHFSATQVRADKLGAVSRYRNAHAAAPALPPAMKRLPATPPGAPRLLSARRGDRGRLIFETAAGAGPSAISWALYRTSQAAATLVATGRAGTEVADPAPPAGPATYCLSGLDRSAHEGPISQPFTAND